MGWSFHTEIDYDNRWKEIQKYFEDTNSSDERWEKYKELCKKFGYKKVNDNIKRFHDDVKEGDYIWMRGNGIYYLAQVSQESKWDFKIEEEFFSADMCNTLTNIDWQKIGDESAVPGVVNTSFIKGFTFQRINKKGIAEFSEYLYKKSTNDHSPLKKIERSQKNFYNWLSPSDCEDLLCMYLFNEEGYVCIPSTNKISTPLYECVLVHPTSGSKIYPQVKKGAVDLDCEKYVHLVEDTNNRVCLFTTEGKYSENNHENIICIDPKDVYEWAIKAETPKHLLPASVELWKNISE